MNKLFLYFLTIVPLSFLSPSFLTAQEFLEPAQKDDFVTRPVKAFIEDQANLRAVTATEFRGRSSSPTESARLEFDSAGRLIREVEVRGADTSQVRELEYTANGLQRAEIRRDNTYSRQYKTGFRFNSDRTVFQTRDYELLGASSAMLLATRNYRYNEDGLLERIQFSHQSRIIQTHAYSYDEEKRRISETRRDEQGETIWSIQYTYDGESDRYAEIKHEKMRPRARTQTFRYQYDEAGNVIEAEVWENGALKETIHYEYDSENRQLVSVLREPTDRHRTGVRVSYNYEFFE